MFLFRPSNNNQRYAFVPLLDQSDNDNDAFDDGDEGGKIMFNLLDERLDVGLKSGRKSFKGFIGNMIYDSQVTQYMINKGYIILSLSNNP